MKKVFALTVMFIAGLSFSANAAEISNGQMAKCNNASSITLEAAKVANATTDKFGYTDNDRGSANLNVWKSSNYTTTFIALGPNDNNDSLNATDHGKTGLPQRGGMGAGKVTLISQPGFSRGDSIGDISGLVKITNTGAVPVTVICN
ncbi:MAG: hypothetical protein HOI59_06295 [Nitrospina sp.]|nr:hypothetical protein [Nitrospina sp.]MBT3415518.1 hypothetical protein [Nitrospina sp.]MBT3855833.1 hypothetical protein [Nitrospina sp.]MBT4105804.1 hypothetical protein [Nitrospina sp.]MBT4390844.1 hypothetical protein [Nitrospina sp.]